MILWRQLSQHDHAEVEAHLDEEEPGTRHVGMLERVPLIALALGAVVLGVLALPPFGDTVARALGEEPLHPTPLEMAASVVVALGVLALVWWRPVPEPGWALAWLGLERATQALVVRPTLALAEALARFDDRVLDRGVAGSAAAALGLARRAATFDDRVLDGAVETTSRASLWTAARAARDDDRWFDGAVEGLAAQLRRLGRLARRPQTGQLHQYYIQAVAVLAIGVLLLVTVR